MPKPPITEAQQSSFKVLFKEKVLSQLPADIQSKWDGELYWVGLDTPKINIYEDLRGTAKSEYEKLANRMRNRSI